MTETRRVSTSDLVVRGDFEIVAVEPATAQAQRSTGEVYLGECHRTDGTIFQVVLPTVTIRATGKVWTNEHDGPNTCRNHLTVAAGDVVRLRYGGAGRNDFRMGGRYPVILVEGVSCG